MPNVLRVKSDDLLAATNLLTRLMKDEHVSVEEFQLLRKMVEAASVRIRYPKAEK